MNIRYQTFLDCGRFRRKLFFFQEEKKQDLAHLFVSTFGVQPLIIHSFSWSAALNPPCVANTRVQKRESFFLYTVVKVFSRDLFLCSYVLFHLISFVVDLFINDDIYRLSIFMKFCLYLAKMIMHSVKCD